MAKRYPILTGGEVYNNPIVKKPTGGGDKRYPSTYQTAKERLLRNIDCLLNESALEDEVLFKNQMIICFRLELDFEAKSYLPSSIISAMPGSKFVGGRKYRQENDTEAKLYFVNTDRNGIKSLKCKLDSDETKENKSFCNNIRSLHEINFLKNSEKIMGFRDDWKQGYVEIVLHPIGSRDDLMQYFYNFSGLNKSNVKIKYYDNSGITFISTQCDERTRDKIASFNILRAVHPLERFEIPNTHDDKLDLKISILSDGSTKTNPIIGVFDGWVDESHPLLSGYLKNNDLVEDQSPNGEQHGTHVCGIALHGQIDEQTSSVPSPEVRVEHFRVLPNEDPYDVIDTIEDVVNERNSIQIFNLSFGPDSPIEDDTINRFTCALDNLAYYRQGNPLFCIAVGNAGQRADGLNRIQSPSDMVNGLGIGAYTFDNNNNKIRASYSCIGSGREGAKVKPDILEFGGCREHGVVCLAPNSSFIRTCGTSLAAPLIAHKAGRLMAKSSDITPQIARALLIHNADLENGCSVKEHGHGFCKEDINEILSCSEKKVTVLYSGSISPQNYLKVPIFSPKEIPDKIKVKLSWTILSLVSPCDNDPDAYTRECIEATFYPHSDRYKYTKAGEKPLFESMSLMSDMENKGWSISDLPVSKTPDKNTEKKHRSCGKWDTVVKYRINMWGSSLSDPFIVLHAMGRSTDRLDMDVKFFIVLTVEIEEFEGSLYGAITQKYRNLTGIKVEEKLEVQLEQDIPKS